MGIGNLTVPTSQDAGDLGRYLFNAFEAGFEVDFQRIDRKRWGLALDWLISQKMLGVATSVAPRMAVAFAQTTYFQTTAALLSRLPPPTDDASFVAFRDDRMREVQVVPRTNGSAVLLAFCGRTHKLGMPINLIHRWFGHLGVHVIYLRDYQGMNYDNGIRSLAPDLVGTLQSLQEIVADLGTRRVVCYGNSLGSYGALRYALELQTEAVLTFAGPTSLNAEFNLARRTRALGLDLLPLYKKANYAPRAHLVYGEHHAFDRIHAERFADLPTVSLEMARGWSGHNVFLHAVLNRRYEPLIRWLVDPHRGVGSP
jgi:pimeloyl-ACP methyl ester carboxylesterase